MNEEPGDTIVSGTSKPMPFPFDYDDSLMFAWADSPLGPAPGDYTATAKIYKRVAGIRGALLDTKIQTLEVEE